MVMAPALLIPFAEAAGLTIAGLGAIEIGKKVQDFVDNNPDATMEILTMLVPGGQGLSTLFKKKAKPVEEEIEISVEEKDPRDLTRKEKAEIMKETAKSSSNKSRDMKKAFEDIIKPGKEEDEFLEGEERYDGGLEEVGKAKGYDYKKFFKADGGRVGYNLGGRATTQDYANALNRVSAGTTYQQQAQAKDYARNEAANELRAALRNTVGMGPSSNTPISNLYNSYGFNTLPGGSSLFGKRGNNFTGVAQRYGGGGDYDRVLDQMVSKKLQPTFYAPKPKPTYRAVSPEAQALNMSQSTYQDIISSGKDPRQYYMDFNNRLLTEAQNPNLLTYGQVMAGPGMSPRMGATPLTQQQIQQQMQNNPQGYQDFDEAVKYYSSNDPYMSFKEEVKDMVDGRDTGYMSGQDYYDTKVLGLDGKGIAEKYGLQYADGGRVGYNLGGLTEQGQRLYDSMSSYGFNDMEIASALDEQQLYPESMTLGMKEEVVTPGKVKSIIPTSDGEGGGGITNITNSNPNFDYETAAYGLDNLTAAEKGLTEEEQKTLDFQKGKDGLMSFAKGLGFALNPLSFFAKKGYDLYKNKVRDARYKEEERLRMEDFQKQKAAALAFEEEKLANTAFQNAMANPTAFYASLNDGAGATSTAESRSTAGTDDTPGTPFANGGLATMFVRRG